MGWVRFPVWDRWGELTRFRIALEASIASEHNRWSTLPIKHLEAATITDPVSGGDFECSLADYKAALANTTLLYGPLLGSYSSLVEYHGRNLVEYALSNKGIPRSKFKNMTANGSDESAAEGYVKAVPVEVWGADYLALKSRSWTDVGGGLAGIVEATVLRNLTSHGVDAVNMSAHNRLVAAGCDPTKWPVGVPVSLDRERFNTCLSNLRSFARAMATCAANL